MPHASHKLSLFLVPADPEWIPDAVTQERILELLSSKGAIDGELRGAGGAMKPT